MSDNRKTKKGESKSLGRVDLVRIGGKIAGSTALAGVGALVGDLVAGPTGVVAGVALGATAEALLVGPDALERIIGVKRRREASERRSREREAEELFDSMFGQLQLDNDTQITAGTHPDNIAARDAIVGPLGILATPIVGASSNPELVSSGDIIILGGPNSTRLSTVVRDVEGPSDRELRQRENPVIPLRYTGMSDATDPSLLRDRRIAWYMEGVGPRATVNWPLIDAKRPGVRLRPEPDRRPGRQILVDGQQAFLPKNNYLLITRLPNYMAYDFSRLEPFDPSVWPHILMISGNHGLGTRAAELLTQPSGLEALRDIRAGLKGAHSFEVILEVSGLEEGDTGRGPLHRFTEIELLDE